MVIITKLNVLQQAKIHFERRCSSQSAGIYMYITDTLQLIQNALKLSTNPFLMFSPMNFDWISTWKFESADAPQLPQQLLGPTRGSSLLGAQGTTEGPGQAERPSVSIGRQKSRQKRCNMYYISKWELDSTLRLEDLEVIVGQSKNTYTWTLGETTPRPVFLGVMNAGHRRLVISKNTASSPRPEHKRAQCPVVFDAEDVIPLSAVDLFCSIAENTDLCAAGRSFCKWLLRCTSLLPELTKRRCQDRLYNRDKARKQERSL